MRSRRKAGSFTHALLASALAASPLAAQSPADAAWSGFARCDLAVSGAGYSDRQSHLWVLLGEASTAQGAIRVHPATWSVAGSGSLTESNGRQTRTATWTSDVRGMSAPIAITVRASDGRLLIKPWHAQLRAQGAVSGTQRLVVDGQEQRPSPIGLEAFEWAFPSVEESATATRVSGTSTPTVTGRVGPMQPARASATATCSWQLERRAAPRERAVIAAGTRRSVDLGLRDRSRFTVVPMPPASDGTSSAGGTAGADRERAPAPPPSFAEQRADFESSLLAALVELAKKVTSAQQLGANDASVDCAALVADVDAAYSHMIVNVQTGYARLIAAAPTEAERAALEKELAAQLATLREERDRVVAQLIKTCEQR